MKAPTTFFRAAHECMTSWAASAAMLLATLLALGLFAEALACLFPRAFNWNQGCWEGSCWFTSIDPLFDLNTRHPVRMLSAYLAGALMAVYVLMRLQASSQVLSTPLASNRPESLIARLAYVERCIESLDEERADLLSRLQKLGHVRPPEQPDGAFVKADTLEGEGWEHPDDLEAAAWRTQTHRIGR